MAIMQMVVVACLGMKNTPERCAVKLRKESPERVLSEGADLGQGQNGHFQNVET